LARQSYYRECILGFRGTAFCIYIVDSDMHVSNIRRTPNSDSMGTLFARMHRNVMSFVHCLSFVCVCLCVYTREAVYISLKQ